MFCPKCGTELPIDSAFCYKCGNKIEINKNVLKSTIESTKIEKKEEVIEDHKELYILHPTYNLKAELLKLSVLIAFTILIFILFVISIISSDDSFESFITYFILTMGLVGIITFYLVTKYAKYDNITYTFYKTKVVYSYNYINIYTKELKYNDIKEITWKQSFFQRIFNLGNITIFTNAENGLSNGIELFDINSPEQVYKKIKTIMNK